MEKGYENKPKFRGGGGGVILFIIYIHIFIFLGLKCCYYICSFNNKKDILDFLSLKKKIEKSFILLFLKSKKKCKVIMSKVRVKGQKTRLLGGGEALNSLRFNISTTEVETSNGMRYII